MKRDGAGGIRALGAAGRALVVLAAAALLGPAVAAAACPGDSPALAPVPVEVRIAFLRERIEAERPAAQRWSRVWGTVNGALTVGQLAAIPFTPDRPGRAVLLGGAATSALGVLQIVLLPVAVRAPSPADRPGEACAEVAQLEQALARGARNQALGTGWLAHTGNVVLNGAIGIGAGLAAGRWQSGALTFAIGVSIGEAQILTQPTGLVRDLARYRAGEVPPIVPGVGNVVGGGAIVSVRVPF